MNRELLSLKIKTEGKRFIKEDAKATMAVAAAEHKHIRKYIKTFPILYCLIFILNFSAFVFHR
jgi:hypothetical protein